VPISNRPQQPLELARFRRTWTFPGWLDRRLPRLAIEPAPEPMPALEEAA
jgi:hypothetical protein